MSEIISVAANPSLFLIIYRVQSYSCPAFNRTIAKAQLQYILAAKTEKGCQRLDVISSPGG